MRKRLERLLSELNGANFINSASEAADWLLRRGVLLPPLAIGDTVYAAIPEEEGDAAFVSEWRACGIFYDGTGWQVAGEDGELFKLGCPLCHLTRAEAEHEI